MKPRAVGRIAFVVGCVIAAVGLIAYQAWWTLAFAIGGAVLAILDRGQLSTGRAIAIGVAASGSILAAGMSLFFFAFGVVFVGGRPCDGCSDTRVLLVARDIGSIVTAIVLALVARRLLATAARSRGRSQVNNATSTTSSQDRTDRVEVEGCIIDTETSAGG